jgi:hypothetical protein
VVYGVGLPIPVPPTGALGNANPKGWLFVVIPIELHIVLAGLRARTVLGLLVVVSTAALFLGDMF